MTIVMQMSLLENREKRVHSRNDGGKDIYYVVRNGDIVGTYRVTTDRNGLPQHASRDYHEVAPPGAQEAYQRYTNWLYDDEADEHNEPPYARGPIQRCSWQDDKLCFCDGSGLVEATTDDEKAFKIAAMMADLR